jgi:uroporphyrinogen decarboxylase
MDKRERIEAAIQGEEVDRVPIALWRHWPGDDQRPADLATAHLRWQDEYDWDFLKVTPANTYTLREWGINDTWKGDIEGRRTHLERVVDSPDDWTSLKVLNPSDGTLGDQLETLRLIQQELGEDVPFVQTIYSPLSQARELAGDPTLIRHMRQNAGQIHHALQTITDTTVRFIQEAKKLGIAGILYEIHHANYNTMAESEYEVFGRPYDLQLLRTVDDDEIWLNGVQINGSPVMANYIGDYPVAFIAYEDRQALPGIGEMAKRAKGAALGGIDRWTLHEDDPSQAITQLKDAKKQTGGLSWIAGTGVNIPITMPASNLRRLRAAVDNL